MFDNHKCYGILGLARSGIAAARKIRLMNGKAFLSELKPRSEIAEAELLEQEFECEFGGHSDRLLQCDEWIVSPGIPLDSEIINKGNSKGIKMISELEFGYQIKHPESSLIAVTGSNGKSTTASLIAHILHNNPASQTICLLAGNIGDAFCSFPIEQPGYDYIVLEVSSFQLDLIETFKPDIAMVLNITPDHLNRYSAFRDYALSKFNVFKNQGKDQHAILNLDDVVTAGLDDSIASVRHYFTLDKANRMRRVPEAWLNGNVLETSISDFAVSIYELQIKGPHNWANALAAVLACQIAGLSNQDIISGLRSFKSLKHRLQYVSRVNGITFYNDSKATNTDSVKYALLSFEQPIRVIMGGSDKGEDFAVLTDLLEKHAKKVYVTGDTADKMRQAWFGKVPMVIISDFEECVRTAFSESMAGDNIVLSPACASFDKFRNFEHRGDTFIEIVRKIEGQYEKKSQ